MRYALVAAGLLAACEIAEPPRSANVDYASMSCDQLLRTQADLRGAFFPDPRISDPTVTPQDSSRQLEWLEITSRVVDRGC